MCIMAVVVLYKTTEKKLCALLESLSLQCDKIIIVKNDVQKYPVLDSFANVEVLELGCNTGIAFAQNRGIEKSVELGAEWILLSDQDSVFPDDYIQKMLFIAEHNSLQHIAALAPVFYDEIKNEYAGIMQGKTKKIVPESGHIYKMAHAIASGMLIPVTALQKCGLMREDFFIDFVDNEWCWRAISCGLNIYCLADVVIHHQLGDRMEKRFGLNIVYRSLFRFYYIIRNGYYLLYHTDYLKGKDRFLFWLLMQKKKAEVLLLNRFDSASRAVVRSAVRNGKAGQFVSYEEASS